jgi:uncharacterized protein YjbK
MKREIELKYRLASKADFDFFQAFLEPLLIEAKETFVQENYFFDTNMLSLKRNGISLRLRKERQQYFICAKQSLKKKKKKDNLSVRLEYESSIDDRIALLLKENLASAIDAFSVLSAKNNEEKITKKTLLKNMQSFAESGVGIVGSFRNERTLLPIVIDRSRLIIECDHSYYPKGIEVFEVEVEFPSLEDAQKKRPLLEMLFQKAHLRTYRSSSKSSRLYRILYSMNEA